jgi:hypothetical protein
MLSSIAQKPLESKGSFLSFKVGNWIFYSFFSLLAIGGLSGPAIFIATGQKVPSNLGLASIFWVLVLSYLLLRRLKCGRLASSLTALAMGVLWIGLIGTAERFSNPERYAIEREWKKNPVFLAMKEKDPKAYEHLLSAVAKKWKELSTQDAQQRATEKLVATAIGSFVERASDLDVIGSYRAIHRQWTLLLKEDAQMCYAYAWGVAAPTSLPEAIRIENKNLLANSIRGATPLPAKVEVAQALAALDKVIAEATRRLGKDAALLENLDDLDRARGDPIGSCKAAVAFGGTLLDVLPAGAAANAIRYLRQSRKP